MRILLAASTFPPILDYLPPLLPEHQVVAAPDPAHLPALLPEADVLVPLGVPITEAVLAHASRLRLVQQWGVGLDNVDIAACTRRGIPVANVPTAASGNAQSVAEHALLLMMSLGRQIDVARRNVRERRWGQPLGIALYRKTVGIIGLGDIGRELAQRCKACGMRVLAVKRSVAPDLAPSLGLDWLGTPEQLPRLLAESDFVVVCCPLNDETRGLVGRTALRQMKRSAYLVNVSRGGVVDHDALVEALDERWIAGAGLDVYWIEPVDPEDPVLRHPHVIATPHIAGVTDASYAGIAAVVAENVRRLERGEPVRWCRNAEGIGMPRS
ncbi:MAG TPA: 2-hydroxyacid dehydrogenase [Chloroflexota bacterium]